MTAEVTMVSFDLEDFTLLATSEHLMPGRNYVGFDELSNDLGDESQGLIELCRLASNDDITKVDMENLLYIECNEDAVLNKVYSPAVWAQKIVDDHGNELELGLVLAIGQNHFPVTQQENGTLTCGRLTGEFNSEIKTNQSGEYYLVPRIDWETDGSIVFMTSLKVDGKANPTTTKNEAEALRKTIANRFKKKESVASLLMKLGEGGGDTVRMQDLEVGEYLVERITMLELIDKETQKEKITYTLTLSSGDTVWARGGVATVLGDTKQKLRNSLLAKGAISILPGNGEKVIEEWNVKAPLTLIISDIKETAPGSNKFSVACKLVLRAPALSGDVAPMQAALAPAKDGAEQEAIPF